VVKVFSVLSRFCPHGKGRSASVGRSRWLCARLLGLALPIVVVALTGGGAFASSSGSLMPGRAAGFPPVNIVTPVVTGIPRDGQMLTSTIGIWIGALPIVYAYQWLRCNSTGAQCVPIASATNPRYRLTSSDVGSTIRSRVTARNSFGSSSAQSTQTALIAAAPPVNLVLPAVSGSAQVGQVLTSSTGSWAGTTPLSYAFQWLRCDGGGGSCVAVAGATGRSYVVASADKGSTLRSKVTATNKAGSASAQSAPSAVVTAGTSSIYWGAYMDGNDTYDYLYGGSWGDAPWDANTWNRFESNAGKRVSIVHWGLGTPWDNDFNHWKTTFEMVRARGDLSAVDMSTGSVPLRDIAGGLRDASIRTWMQQAAAYAHPLFLILDVEMNGTWEPYSPGVNGNTASDFVNMWRHVHDLAVQAGASNLTWVWAPNVDPRNLFTPYSQVYPGDGYVDWTGLDGFNMDGTSSFSWLYGPSYNALLQLAPTKPIMVTQVASVEGGNGKAAWITDALSTQLPQSFPQIKALAWFNWRFYAQSTWWAYEIESSASSQAAFATGIATAYYAPGGGFGNLPLLKKINPP
jgi:hypothetical protein